MGSEKLFDGCVVVDATCQGPEVLSGSEGLPTSKGILLFSDENRTPVQLLIAANMRRSAKTRLWHEKNETPSKRADIGRIVRKVYYRSCYNDFNTTLTCVRTAKSLFSDSWGEIVKLPRAVCVSIDLCAKWPFFCVTEKIDINGSVKSFGPFPSRKAAIEFAGVLERGFGLCQRPDLIGTDDKYKTCPYLQMGSCPGPCAGKISREGYLGQIKNAVDAATGNGQRYVEEFGREMERLGGEMLFEEAEVVKGRIEAIERLQKKTFSWTGDLEELAVLHIDRSAKVRGKDKRKRVQTFAGFLITGRSVYRFKDFDIDGIEKFRSGLLERLGGTGDIDDDGLSDKERIGLLCSYLYRNSRQGFWLDVSERGKMPEAEWIAASLKKVFEL
ncbi:MAG: hypothetical protein FVQ79_03000 [Planctomycetes bacterium]|nr:hypothetical protein [Planctomycetota bacterium]